MDINGVLLFCSIWTALLIPFTFLLATEMSNNKYVGLVASLLMVFSPVIYKLAPGMPYQPRFLPTLSCLFIWMVLYNNRVKSFSLLVLSGAIWTLGTQFHLSFLILLPFFILNIYQLTKAMSKRKKIYTTIFVFILAVVFLGLNTTLPKPNLTDPPKLLNPTTFITTIIDNINQDFEVLFPIKLGLPLLLGSFMVMFYKARAKLFFIIPIIVMYPFVGIFGYYNEYTAVFWPIFIVLISSLTTLFKNQWYPLLISVIMVIFLSGNTFKLIAWPINMPSHASEKALEKVTKQIDKHLSKSGQNMVFQYNGFLNTFMGYYYYQEIKENRIIVDLNEKYSKYLKILNNDSITKIVYCVDQCDKFLEEYTRYDEYLVKNVETGNDYSIFRIEKKYNDI